MNILRTRQADGAISEGKADASIQNYELGHNEELSERDALDMRRLGVRQETKVRSLSLC